MADRASKLKTNFAAEEVVNLAVTIGDRAVLPPKSQGTPYPPNPTHPTFLAYFFMFLFHISFVLTFRVFCAIRSPASSDFPPLAPFYRSHSTGSLTPADIPSASSRVCGA